MSFGPYRIESLLGRGGMGEVYRAHDSRVDRMVALKVLPAHLITNPEYVARFHRECRSAARLTDPHIVPIHGFGELEGRLYLDMRLVEGIDLSTWLVRHGPLAPLTAVNVIEQVASALDAAHTDGLVHRDVTPSNVLLAGVAEPPLVDSKLFVYLLDFGLARRRPGAGGPDTAHLTRAGVVAGSPSYVAPERLKGSESEPTADVYSLACVLQEALTGRPPFTGEVAELVGAHIQKTPPRASIVNPEVPPSLDTVIAKGMAKNPLDRYDSAGALAEAARAALDRYPTPRNAIPAAPAAITIMRRPPSLVGPSASGPLEHPGGQITEQPARESTGDIPEFPVGEPTQHGPGLPGPDAVNRGVSSEVTDRFGPGITAPPSSSTAPSGWGRVPTSTRTQMGTRFSWRRIPVTTRLVLGVLAVAMALLALTHQQTNRLQVLDASIVATGDPAQQCNVAINLAGTIHTNGVSGDITYTWTRSDGTIPTIYTQAVTGNAVTVHLVWDLMGAGDYTAVATLNVLTPTPQQATTTFVYKCPQHR